MGSFRAAVPLPLAASSLAVPLAPVREGLRLVAYAVLVCLAFVGQPLMSLALAHTTTLVVITPNSNRVFRHYYD